MADLNLRFLKLGGSLITDKSAPHTARPQVLARLAREVASAFQADPDLRLILGHGSGSFGHVPAKKYGTRQSVRTPEQWRGFIEVWHEAAALNKLVIEALTEVGLPALSFPPSACVAAQAGQVVRWDLVPIQAALHAGLLPVIYGDVAFDLAWGGTILSTEDLFAHLARMLKPQRILLAGLEPGVWADYPVCQDLISEIGPQNLAEISQGLQGSAGVDVTGGMASKVRQSLDLVQEIPGLVVEIFSAETPGLLQRALRGEQVGTRLHG